MLKTESKGMKNCVHNVTNQNFWSFPIYEDTVLLKFIICGCLLAVHFLSLHLYEFKNSGWEKWILMKRGIGSS